MVTIHKLYDTYNQPIPFTEALKEWLRLSSGDSDPLEVLAQIKQLKQNKKELAA